ncbi:MAG: TrkH family potassium uptake protein [Candidatus Avigastranaerophilus sp.]
MNITSVLSIISIILRFFSVMILVPCVCAIMFKDYNSIVPFVIASLLALIASLLLRNKNNGEDELNKINRTEVFCVMLLAWGSLCLLGAIPFFYFGLSPVDAIFESVSGITTTGATILSGFSKYPETMFFWRSFSQWLGGMGILVLFTVILPQFSIAGRQMFFTEVPGSQDNNLTPRIRQTAAWLWGIYFTLTVAEIIVLTYLKMPLFDAVCTSFSTISGGGFSPKEESLIAYGQVKYIWAVAIFIFFAGFNFALQFKAFVRGKIVSLFKDEEFRLYFFIVAVFTTLIALTLTSHHIYDFSRSVREAFFQVLSVITTAGFASVDYAQWNLRAKLFLFILMFTGASIGSASGGIKLFRLIVIFKYLKRQISKIHHPNGVYPIKINRAIMNEDAIKQVVSFVLFYYGIFVLSAILLIFIEQNAITGVSASIATLGNVGPGFGEVIGPMGSYGALHISSKIICTFNMLIGRLELIPFLALLHPDFWNFKRVLAQK